MSFEPASLFGHWSLDFLVAFGAPVDARLMRLVALRAFEDVEVALVRVESLAVDGDASLVGRFPVATVTDERIGVGGCRRRGAVAGLAPGMKARDAGRARRAQQRRPAARRTVVTKARVFIETPQGNI